MEVTGGGGSGREVLVLTGPRLAFQNDCVHTFPKKYSFSRDEAIQQYARCPLLLLRLQPFILAACVNVSLFYLVNADFQCKWFW